VLRVAADVTRTSRLFHTRAVIAGTMFFINKKHWENFYNVTSLFMFCVVSLDKCKSMDSKMKPLWLVWTNSELAAGTKTFESFVMFKKGDGK